MCATACYVCESLGMDSKERKGRSRRQFCEAKCQKMYVVNRRLDQEMNTAGCFVIQCYDRVR